MVWSTDIIFPLLFKLTRQLVQVYHLKSLKLPFEDDNRTMKASIYQAPKNVDRLPLNCKLEYGSESERLLPCSICFSFAFCLCQCIYGGVLKLEYGSEGGKLLSCSICLLFIFCFWLYFCSSL